MNHKQFITIYSALTGFCLLFLVEGFSFPNLPNPIDSVSFSFFLLGLLTNTALTLFLIFAEGQNLALNRRIIIAVIFTIPPTLAIAGLCTWVARWNTSAGIMAGLIVSSLINLFLFYLILTQSQTQMTAPGRPTTTSTEIRAEPSSQAQNE